MKTTLPLTSSFKPSILAALLAATSLTACKDDQPARIAAPEPASLAQMDALSGLPYAEPLPVRYAPPEVGYGYAERAYDLQRDFYDEPPDYGFAYDGYEPLVWRTADDWEMYAEPWDDGYRYYYYEPGGSYPYWVQAGDYGYGYDTSTGVLISVLTVAGVLLAADQYDDYAPLASRYYVRGYQLHEYARRAPRIAVTEVVWRERAPVVYRTAAPWVRQAPEARPWKEWREKGGRKRGWDRQVAVLPEREFRPPPTVREGRPDRVPPGQLRQAQRSVDVRDRPHQQRSEQAQVKHDRRQDAGRTEVRQQEVRQAQQRHEHQQRLAQQQAEREQQKPVRQQAQQAQRQAQEQRRAQQQAQRPQHQAQVRPQGPQQARSAEAHGRQATAVEGGKPRQGGGGGNPHPGGAKAQGGGAPHADHGKGGGKKDR